MDIEKLKRQFIILKKEELEYIERMCKLSIDKKFTEFEKLNILRTLNNYKTRINECLKLLREELIKVSKKEKMNHNDIIIEFPISEKYLHFLKDLSKGSIFYEAGIDEETYTFKLKLSQILKYKYHPVNIDHILKNQRLLDFPIYIFTGIEDELEECFGPAFGDPEDYQYAIYKNIVNSRIKRVHKDEASKFEKENTVISPGRYVSEYEAFGIFQEELLNEENVSINACVEKAKERCKELNYNKSPEHKEKALLEKINELSKKVKGKFIKNEVLYSGSFLKLIKEVYRLPNDQVVEKEKIIKNNGKDCVIIIAITREGKYILTFQNRMDNSPLSEFPSGYIEEGESPIDAAIRELEEETGYVSSDLSVIDKAYTSPGIDNSRTYIVLANSCTKQSEVKQSGTELVEYGVFSQKELDYFIEQNIMAGTANRLAYYILKTNFEDIHLITRDKEIFKRERKKYNTLEL